MTETKFHVKHNFQITENVYEMTVVCEKFQQIIPGQFLNVTVSDSFTLKRPFGILNYSEKENELVFAYRIVGKGTEEMSKWKNGKQSTLTFPLGNGFIIPQKIKKVAIVGGGIGVFPLNSLFTQKNKLQYFSFLGYNNKQNCYYLENFQKNSNCVFVATDDGSYGEHGFVTTVFEREIQKIKPDIVLACGPNSMLKALQQIVARLKLFCLASTEESMGCGVGACLVCACKTLENGEIKNKRVCADGPVFDLNRIIF